ncbi:MAG: hypothetical protein PHS14_02880 [Elusimicrobia bacterium]|nr:hypothetical protein [Elusimicrobiota bacterium]
MKVDWYGDRIKAKLVRSSVQGVNRTMAQAVGQSKAQHPWQNRTTTLEKGIRIVKSAVYNSAVVSGMWGVANVLYGKYLEASDKWTWLRPAALVTYPRLKANIKEAYRA